MILDDVTMPEYERGLLGSRTVLIPFGSLEEHGAHLPLSTDTLQVVRSAGAPRSAPGRTWPRGRLRRLPEHAQPPGTVGLSTSTLRAWRSTWCATSTATGCARSS